ncbi:MAG: DUF1343 domain-containing protein [Eubacteriales bacterium]
MNNNRCAAGIDNFSTISHKLNNARVGLLTGPSAQTRAFRSTPDVIASNCRLKYIFASEHGLYGDLQDGLGDGEKYIDRETGAEVISLYESHQPPPADLLLELDYLLYDIQDVGARFYTYLSTLTDGMTAAASAGIPIIVFDRPGMIGLDRIEGNILNPKFSSYVGRFPVPTRYGLTIGEYARYINNSQNIGCDLTVIPCEGLTRRMYYDDTGLAFINPSPNINSVDCAINYVGTCLFEATNVSEGRGTTQPFSLIGAPWIDNRVLTEGMKEYGFEGVYLRPAWFTPLYGKYKGERCEGVQIHITDRGRYQPFEFAVRMIDELRARFTEFKMTTYIDLLFGDDRLRAEYIGRPAVDRFFTTNQKRLADWAASSYHERIY